MRQYGPSLIAKIYLIWKQLQNSIGLAHCWVNVALQRQSQIGGNLASLVSFLRKLALMWEGPFCCPCRGMQGLKFLVVHWIKVLLGTKIHTIKIKFKLRLHASPCSNSGSQFEKRSTANDHRKTNLTEVLIQHAFKLLPALKIQCFYWLSDQQSESVWVKSVSAFFKQLFEVWRPVK